MKKFFILFAAVAMIAMTACNEKPAKETKEKAETVAVNDDKAMVGKELLDTADKKMVLSMSRKPSPLQTARTTLLLNSTLQTIRFVWRTSPTVTSACPCGNRVLTSPASPTRK